jgi:hypothetical protein
MRSSIKANDRNNLKQRASDLKKSRNPNRPVDSAKVKDVRKSALKDKAGDAKLKKTKAAAKQAKNNGKVDRPVGKKKSAAKVDRPTGKGKIDRPVGKKKPAAKIDRRPQKVSGLGDINRGKVSKLQSKRGSKAMGGGYRGGGRAHSRPVRRGGGRRR